jgi:hypothetical protein
MSKKMTAREFQRKVFSIELEKSLSWIEDCNASGLGNHVNIPKNHARIMRAYDVSVVMTELKELKEGA